MTSVPPDAATTTTRSPVLGWRHVAVLVTGPLALAIAGVTHPAHLTSESADWWRDLHVVMLPLFPLLAINVWVLLRGVWAGVDGIVAVGARVLAFVYAAFYTALDVLAGIANGALVEASTSSGFDVSEPKSIIFGQGGDLAEVGVYSLLASSALVGVVYVRRFGLRMLPGSLVLLASSYSFIDSHVYPVRGVVTMLGFGVAAVLLAVPAVWASRTKQASPAADRGVGC